MGAVISDDFTEQELDRDYYGLYYGYAALPVKPEKISYLTNNAIENAVVTNFETNQKTAVYDMEKAAGKDPYEMFLSGSVSLLTIENPSAKTDKELVIFRDSFASSLAPLLIEGVREDHARRYPVPAERAAGKLRDIRQAGRTVFIQCARAQQQRDHQIKSYGRQTSACLPLFINAKKN